MSSIISGSGSCLERADDTTAPPPPLPSRSAKRVSPRAMSSSSNSVGDHPHRRGSKSTAGAGAMKSSSAYVPHNRFSRYIAALSSLALVRFKSAPGSELPLDKIGLLSSLSFRWLNEYLLAGYRSGMKDKTLPSLSKRETCDVNGPRLDSLLQAHFVEKGQAGASIPQVAWQFVRTRVLIGSFIYLLGSLISLAGPIFVLREIIEATSDRNLQNLALSKANKTMITVNASALIIFEESLHQKERKIVNDEIIIFSHTGVLILVELFSHVLVAWSSALNIRTACRLRSACLAVSYKKLLVSSLRCSTSAQQTLTYFVPDSETLHELISLGPLVLTGPAILLLVSCFTWLVLGRWALVGILIVILLYFALMVAAYFMKSFAARAIEYSLRRMSLVEEFISNIQLAKITLWDKHFQGRIKDVRRRELAELQFGGVSEGCGLSMVHMIPVFAVTTIMLVSLSMDQLISFQYQAVPVVVIFLINLKHCIRTSWMALSSISRGLAFLNKLKTILILQPSDRFVDKPIDRKFAIIIHNGHFTWSKDKLRGESGNAKRASRFYVDGYEGNAIELSFPSGYVTTLSEIDFFVPKGKLVGIYGHQDSGKTSFLLSILGQLQCIGGTVAIDGTCAYLATEPWLMDGTLKENVLFGEKFDSSRYYRAIRSSHLNAEIGQLPELDDTELGAAGIGSAQRQKIGIARAVYAQRDINLLDEPFADLSSTERLQLFESCVMEQMMGKTVIVASGRIELLSRCHVVYVMQGGKIVESGCHQDLVQLNGPYAKLARLQTSSHRRKTFKSSDLSCPSPSRLTPSSPKDFLSSTTSSFDSINNNDDSRPLHRALDFPVLHSFSRGKPKTGIGVYLKYSGGWPMCFLLLLLSCLYAFAIATAPISINVGQSVGDGTWTIGILVTLVGFLIVCGIILTVIYNKAIFMAATKLHNRWIDSLGSAQISLFNTSTISLLLNICSLNMQEVDSVLPRSIVTVLINAGISSCSLVILSWISSWLILPVVAFGLISIVLSVYVRGAVLSLHELKVSSATLVLNHIGSTVQGRATIQAFSKEKDFTKKYYKLFDENSTYDFMLYATRLWLEFRLKLIAVLVLSAVIFLCELISSISLMELCLAYICTLQLAYSLLYTITTINDVYTSLMSLNSVDHYMQTIPKEREGTARLSSMWPTDGCIEFKNVSLYDREESSKKPLSFVIPSASKIAVYSWDASERMAFVSALFRFMELPAGEIQIGGTSVAEVPIDMLRRCMCFVPGNPMLFNGTIRHNLDPSERMADQSLMRVLQKVYLWEKVARLPEKLVSDSRHLFTVYEKVLIFLARALLNEQTKIIIIEEPQADITDDRGEILEAVLRDAFANYTVIRLSSHRVRTCSRHLYLDDDADDYISDQGSSTLSQLTTTTEVYTALPANVLSDDYNEPY